MRPREDGMVQVEVRIDSIMVDLEEHIENVRKAAEGLIDVQVDVDSEWESSYIKVSGWRLPNAEEIKQMALAQAARERQARNQLRQLRRDHPSLFDKQGRVLKEILVVNDKEVAF